MSAVPSKAVTLDEWTLIPVKPFFQTHLEQLLDIPP